MNEFMRTDEYVEASNSLKMTIDLLKRVKQDSYYWKWAIIAFHNCLQAFMVLALKGSNSLSVMRRHDMDRWLEAYYENKPLPETRLKSFKQLFESLSSHEMNLYVHSKKFVPEPKHIKAVDIINRDRNSFIHFQPMGWSLQIDGYPGAFLILVEVLEFIVNESGNLLISEENYLGIVRKDINNLKTELDGLENYYNEKIKK